VVGPRFTIADVILFAAVDFGRGVGQPLDPALGNLAAWFARVSARPSAAASLHPMWEAVGSRG
jgi:glutathione S-transferase